MIRSIFIAVLLSLTACATPFKPDETTIIFNAHELEKLNSGQKILIPVTRWDEDAGYRRDTGEKVFCYPVYGKYCYFSSSRESSLPNS